MPFFMSSQLRTAWQQRPNFLWRPGSLRWGLPCSCVILLLLISPSMAADSVQLEELWRIGGDTEDPDQFFGVINAMVEDADGNLYLLDSQLHDVKIFDADGNFVRAIGREGEGPGEFRRPADLFLMPNGDVGVLQRAPGKIVLMTPEGDPAGEYPLPESEDGGFRFLSQARYGDEILILAMSAASFGGERSGFSTSLIALDRDGNEVGRYFEQFTRRDRNNPVIDEKSGGFFSTLWELAADGTVYLSRDFDAYKIEVFDSRGGQVRVIEQEYTLRERSSKQKQRMKRRLRPRGRHAARAELKISDTDRSIQRIYPKADGGLLVLTSRGAFDVPEGSSGVFDVFDAEGQLVRQVSLLGEGNFERDGFFFRGDRLYVVTGLQEAIDAMRGGNTDDEDEDWEEEPQPVAVIAYRIGDGLP